MKRIFKLIPVFFLLLSCSKSDFSIPEGSVTVSDSDLQHDMIVLGEKLDDPYTVANMTKAFESLYPTKASRSYVTPTDYYVRILPSGEEQYRALKDKGLMLIDHPLDYSILREGDYYHDPSVPEGEITWQYAVVSPDFVFPDGIVWEKLDECFLPEHQSPTKAGALIDWDAVEAESFRISGNALGAVSKGGGDSRPVGRIAIVDDYNGGEAEGVKGVMVCANSFVRISTAYTDEDGCYTLPQTFNAESVRYRLVFTNEKGFNIGFNLLLVPSSISTLGKHGPEGVSIAVDRDSDRKLFTRCVVNNAGYDYCSQCSEEEGKITPPPGDLRIWIFRELSRSATLMLQQGVLVDGGLLADYLGQYIDLVKKFLPDMFLGLKEKDDYRSIYAEAIHGFAHASHYSQVGSSWWTKYDKYILKTFALSIGRDVYGSRSDSGSDYCELAEMWAYYLQTSMIRERYSDPDAIFGTSWWFSPQILISLEERGMDRLRLFNSFTEDVTDREILQERMLSLYPEFKSVIRQMFIRYN